MGEDITYEKVECEKCENLLFYVEKIGEDLIRLTCSDCDKDRYI